MGGGWSRATRLLERARLRGGGWYSFARRERRETVLALTDGLMVSGCLKEVE